MGLKCTGDAYIQQSLLRGITLQLSNEFRLAQNKETQYQLFSSLIGSSAESVFFDGTAGSRDCACHQFGFPDGTKSPVLYIFESSFLPEDPGYTGLGTQSGAIAASPFEDEVKPTDAQPQLLACWRDKQEMGEMLLLWYSSKSLPIQHRKVEIFIRLAQAGWYMLLNTSPNQAELITAAHATLACLMQEYYLPFVGKVTEMISTDSRSGASSNDQILLSSIEQDY
ncbi:hypothetical protein EDD85DRAFT_793621 [Armillaria nabsnona]|nr:hypothetical protein EDD85DRAFT_793621 [Armillaria nabsnona]